MVREQLHESQAALAPTNLLSGERPGFWRESFCEPPPLSVEVEQPKTTRNTQFTISQPPAGTPSGHPPNNPCCTCRRLISSRMEQAGAAQAAAAAQGAVNYTLALHHYYEAQRLCQAVPAGQQGPEGGGTAGVEQ